MSTRPPCFALLLLALASFATGCHRAHPGRLSSGAGTQSDSPTSPAVRALVAKAKQLLRTQDEALWATWTEGAPLSLSATYAGHESLFGLDSISLVEKERSAAKEPREVRALTHLSLYLSGEFLSRGLTEQTEAISQLEASMTFPFEGRDVAYRDLDRTLAKEASTAKRHALYAAATRSVERLNPWMERRDARLEALLLELGYPSYESYGEELRQTPLSAASDFAEQLLEQTQTPYQEVLDRLSQKELALPPSQLRLADLPRLVRLVGADSLFPKESLLPRAATTLRSMGIDLNNLAKSNLRLELSDSPKRNPRRLSLAVAIPADIRLSMRPVGGRSDMQSLLHELGHCLPDAFAKETRFELTKLGNLVVSEAYAYLFESLVDDRVWLAENTALSGEKLDQYLLAARVNELFAVRRTAGTLLYDLALHSSEQVEPRALYSTLFSRAYGIPLNSDEQARFRVEAGELYASIDQLRARMLGNQLREQLAKRFGAAWWKSPASGEFLRKLWSSSNARSAEEVAVAAGESGIKPEALLTKLLDGL